MDYLLFAAFICAVVVIMVSYVVIFPSSFILLLITILEVCVLSIMSMCNWILEFIGFSVGSNNI